MQVTVYLDLIFIINFLVDFYVLAITGILFHRKLSMVRIGLGALFGSLTLLPCMLFPKLIMGFGGVVIMTGISMGAVMISLGNTGGLIKKWFLSTTIMVLFGGVFSLLKSRFGVLHITFYTWLIFIFASGIIVWIVIGFIVRQRKERNNICRIYIQNQGRMLEEDVLMDTGNRLWDSRFDRPVMLLSEELVKKIVSHKEYELIKEYKTKGYIDYSNPILLKTQKTCFHEISFQSVGKMSGKLLCFLIDEIYVVEASESGSIKDMVQIKKNEGRRIDDSNVRHYRKQPCAVADEKLFIGKAYKGLLFPDNI